MIDEYIVTFEKTVQVKMKAYGTSPTHAVQVALEDLDGHGWTVVDIEDCQPWDVEAVSWK